LIGKLFPELTEEVSQKVDAPHLGLTLEQSDREVAPGQPGEPDCRYSASP
jgi:hypothetical protein